ncbi:uncharacterized protein FTOL_01979 [Fusarium torulosum]|uniref:Uncharacterized protein n=1 Tax=Fusarium torulosum TaxID=33205 RepID=A0AAE8M0X8_9HYPO|nr:uncharacterized protein FTOL_01979 [Fusarium torulosum]
MKPNQPPIILNSSVGYSTTSETTSTLNFLRGDEQKQQAISESEIAQAYFEQSREVLQTDPEKYEKINEEYEESEEVRVENNPDEDAVNEESMLYNALKPL